MSDEEQKVEQPVVEEEPKVVEQPKPESPKKITVPPKKKEKDPKKVAQGKRLAQISEKAKKDKMRREIEEESQIDFSVDYNTLIYFGVPSIVFAGFYLYYSSKNKREGKPTSSPPKTKNDDPPAKPVSKHVSLFD